MGTAWTYERLHEWVAGGRVSFMDPSSASPRVPAELAGLVDPDQPASAAAFLSTIFQADRADLIKAWKVAHDHPGEPAEAHYRVRTADGWARERVRIVDLNDHPGFGFSVVLRDDHEVVTAFVSTADPHPEQREASPWMIMYVDADARILFAEGMTTELTGRAASELVGMFSFDFVHPDDVAAIAMAAIAVAQGDHQEAGSVVHRLVHPDGSLVWVEGTIMNQQERFKANVVLLIDITEKRRRDLELRALAEEYRLLAEEVPSAVFRADEDGRIEFGNERWHELVSAGHPVKELRDIARIADQSRVDELIWDIVSAHHDGKRSVEVMSEEGRNLRVTCRAVGEPGTSSRKMVGALADVTDNALLRFRAEFDPLTGVLNREGIDQRVAAVVADSEPALVLFLDLDGFKLVNDEYGHHAGDIVLQVMAQRLRRSVRPHDDVGRYGGDEFVIVCHQAPVGADDAIHARITKALDEPIAFDGGTWQPRASLGAARLRPGDTAESLLRRADDRMYRHKREHNR